MRAGSGHSGDTDRQRIWRKAWEWEPLRYSLILFLILRLALSSWAVLVLATVPGMTNPDELARPYYGIEPVDEGVAGWLLGPWQRFDTLHYLRLALYGYEPNTAHTVFAPLYPLLIRGLGSLLGGRHLLAALSVSNLSALGYFIVLFMLAKEEIGRRATRRALLYTAVFPTGFFLLAAYTEPLFLLLAVSAILAARRERPWVAGTLGLLASLTRLPGWILALPLAYEYLRRRDFNLQRLDWSAASLVLPPLGMAGFLGWRRWAGLSPLARVYADHWLQSADWVWSDLITSVQHILTGQATLVLVLNLVCAGLLLATAAIALRRLSLTYSLYVVPLLLFTLTASSAGRPLNALSRYTLVFFPMFMLLGRLGRRRWVNRLILYLSTPLLLYLSGQFFLWGWVA